MKKLLFLVVILSTQCKQKEVTQMVEYKGPLMEAVNVDMLYSERDQIKVKMKAAKMSEYKNGDREFPEGIFLEFYDEKGVMTSSLRANEAYYFKAENQWRGRGDVEVKNIQKRQQLNSEELFWAPETKRIFTEKFVTIRMENEVIYGTGLEALQDMSKYTIKKPAGDFEIQD